MKTFLFALLFFPQLLMAIPELTEPDTVIIRIGKDEVIKIVSNNPNELERLSEFDLNAIIQDIKIQVETNQEDITIQIEDSTGEKYILKKEGVHSDSLTLEEKLDRLSRRMEALGDSLDKTLSGESSSEEQAVHFNRRRHYGTKRTVSFDLGFNNYLTDGKFPDESDALYAVNPFYSWYIALGGVSKTHVGGPLFLDWGANVSWYNFKFENSRTRVKKENGALVFLEDTLVSDPIKSKLAVPYLNVTFVPVFHFGNRKGNNWHDYDTDRGVRIGVGVYAGYRLGGKTKYVYKEEGDREREKDKSNFYINNWRYGLRTQIGIGGIDLFVNYDLNDLFVENRGPQLNAFSFGLVF